MERELRLVELRHDAGFVEQADVLLHNTRPKPAARLGIDAARLHEVNPRLIHCATVGFGSDGPWADRPAYDDVVQAAGGLAALPTETGQAPAFVPTIVADKIAGLHAGQAILAALVRRGRTGEGCAIEVPMFECLVAFLFNEHLDAASFDAQAAPGYRRLLNAYRRPHATRDGWLAVIPYSETHWRRLLEEIGRDDFLAADWFATAGGRNAHSDRLYAAMSEGLAQRPTAEWLECLRRLDIPHSEVASLRELLNHPHLAAKDFFRATDELGGRVRSVPNPLLFPDGDTAADRAAPELGADTRAVLADLGLDSDDETAVPD